MIIFYITHRAKYQFMYHMVQNLFKVQVYEGPTKYLSDMGLNNFDLIINNKFVSLTKDYSTTLNSINPKKVLNHIVSGSLKTYQGLMFEKHFGVKLNIYQGDDYKSLIRKEKGGIFCKNEIQTLGKYWLSDKPIFKPNVVNQINYGNETGIYGLYYVLGNFIYAYNYRGDDYYVKYHNYKQVDYFNHDETTKLFGSDLPKFKALADEMGIDYCRFDVIRDPEVGNVVVDINTAPGGKQLFKAEFIETGIHEEAQNIVYELLKERIDETKIY